MLLAPRPRQPPRLARTRAGTRTAAPRLCSALPCSCIFCVAGADGRHAPGTRQPATSADPGVAWSDRGVPAAEVAPRIIAAADRAGAAAGPDGQQSGTCPSPLPPPSSALPRARRRGVVASPAPRLYNRRQSARAACRATTPRDPLPGHAGCRGTRRARGHNVVRCRRPFAGAWKPDEASATGGAQVPRLHRPVQPAQRRPHGRTRGGGHGRLRWRLLVGIWWCAGRRHRARRHARDRCADSNATASPQARRPQSMSFSPRGWRVDSR